MIMLPFPAGWKYPGGLGIPQCWTLLLLRSLTVPGPELNLIMGSQQREKMSRAGSLPSEGLLWLLLVNQPAEQQGFCVF
ncbi:hypothetical protein VULLAG_LOCUS7929 [Vulpes lagopus]